MRRNESTDITYTPDDFGLAGPSQKYGAVILHNIKSELNKTKVKLFTLTSISKDHKI